MLKFVICDDNLILMDKMEVVLSNIFAKNNLNGSVVFKSGCSDEILRFVNKNPVDVILLDINLKSTKTGIQLAELIRKKKKNLYLIFTTSYLEYAMIAYKYKTFDFIAKPLSSERIEETIIRLFNDVECLNKNYIKIDNKNTLVDDSEIAYIKRDGMKLVFHTESKDYDSYTSFVKIENTLPQSYIRCHKSYIANIDKIKDIEPVTNTITFFDGHTCEIGPKYKTNLMEVMKNYGTF